MCWLLRKIDSLIGTVIAAVVGLAASQLLAFIHAYQQRLGGHLDEARLGQREMLAGKLGPVVTDEAMREQLAAMARMRVDALETAYRAIEQADIFAKPVVFATHVDRDIALATARAFHPALPLDTPSLVYGLVGLVIGWLIWELVKSPWALTRRAT